MISLINDNLENHLKDLKKITDDEFISYILSAVLVIEMWYFTSILDHNLSYISISRLRITVLNNVVKIYVLQTRFLIMSLNKILFILSYYVSFSKFISGINERSRISAKRRNSPDAGPCCKKKQSSACNLQIKECWRG